MTGREARAAATYRTVGAWVKKHRKAKGWTQAELGKRLDYSPAAISAIEAGRQRVHLDTVLEMERLLRPSRYLDHQSGFADAVLGKDQT